MIKKLSKLSRLSEPKQMIKSILIAYGIQIVVISAIFLFVLIALMGVLENEHGSSLPDFCMADLPNEVLRWEDEMRYWARQYEIEDRTWLLLAIMQVESRGLVPDLMQSSGATRFSIST